MRPCASLIAGVLLLVGCSATEEADSREAQAEAAEGTLAESPRAGEVELEERIAPDGRPEWWFPEPRFDDAGLTVCVETIALSLRGARESATELGLERAALWIESRGRTPIPDTYSVERVWAWPLPELPGREERYAGYALVRMEMVERSD